jgi:hypothetical protein
MIGSCSILRNSFFLSPAFVPFLSVCFSYTHAYVCMYMLYVCSLIRHPPSQGCRHRPLIGLICFISSVFALNFSAVITICANYRLDVKNTFRNRVRFAEKPKEKFCGIIRRWTVQLRYLPNIHEKKILGDTFKTRSSPCGPFHTCE